MRAVLSFLYLLVSWVVYVVAGLSVMLTVMGWFGGIWWFFDLVNPFKMQLFWIQTVALAFFFWQRHSLMVALTVVCWLSNGAALLPFYIYERPKAAEAEARIRILQMNVLYKNWNHSRALTVIRDENPDIVTMEEVTPHWENYLRGSLALKKDYPYQFFNKRGELAFLSRLPVIAFRQEALPAPGHKNWFNIAQVRSGTREITIFQIHPRVPLPEEGEVVQRRHLLSLVEHRGDLPRPQVVVGDFNLTPWSRNFHILVDGFGLRNSMRGFGIQSTYPHHAPFFYIPIDHCLVSEDMVVTGRRVGPYSGSDHLPIVIEVGFRKQPENKRLALISDGHDSGHGIPALFESK